MHEKDKRDNGTARKVLVVTSGANEDYREAHFYVPTNFSWAQVAEEVAARKRCLNAQGARRLDGEDLMSRALIAVGCERIKVDHAVCVDELHIDWDEQDRVTYARVNAFIAQLKERS